MFKPMCGNECGNEFTVKKAELDGCAHLFRCEVGFGIAGNGLIVGGLLAISERFGSPFSAVS